MRKVKLQEFLTPKRTLVFRSKNGKKIKGYNLQPYNLAFHSLIYSEFATEQEPDGTKNFINRLSNNDPIATTKVIYLLIEDKSDFPTFEDFTKSLDNVENPIYDFQILLTQIFQDSLPKWHKKKAFKTSMTSMTLMIAVLMIFAGILYMT